MWKLLGKAFRWVPFIGGRAVKSAARAPVILKGATEAGKKIPLLGNLLGRNAGLTKLGVNGTVGEVGSKVVSKIPGFGRAAAHAAKGNKIRALGTLAGSAYVYNKVLGDDDDETEQTQNYNQGLMQENQSGGGFLSKLLNNDFFKLALMAIAAIYAPQLISMVTGGAELGTLGTIAASTIGGIVGYKAPGILSNIIGGIAGNSGIGDMLGTGGQDAPGHDGSFNTQTQQVVADNSGNTNIFGGRGGRT
ncbi:MAG: hypothetical protein ACTSXQ_03610 [Alphaproteobacteria bacterium]